MAPQYPRWRTIQHIRKQAGTQGHDQEFPGSGSPHIQNTLSPLGRDPTAFLSYFAPSFSVGEYLATATQSVINPDTGAIVNLISRQPFQVHGPRFSLQPGVVHQVYPPTGTSEHNNVLPHIVLEDPHLPWEQAIVPDESEHHTRNRVPWLALLVFEETDIKLDPGVSKPVSKGGVLPNPQQGMPDQSVAPDSVTFTVKTTVGDVVGLAGMTLARPFQFPLKKEDLEADELAQPIDLIYVQQQMVDNLFNSSAADGSRIEVQPNQVPDLSRYAYLSHVRKNASAQHDANNDEHYSLVIAHQTGSMKDLEPKTLIVHLVSLEGVTRNVRLRPAADTQQNGLVGLISLYSWTFTSLPPDQVNLIASLRTIGADLQGPPAGKGDCWLRAPGSIVDALRSNQKTDPRLAKKLAERLEDGFMLQRYLLQTGEETVAFFRGPLTPTYVKPITDAWWPTQSNSSTDYQILDPNMGVMDVSYSAAWQLGKVLGLANQQFAAALVRLRSSICIEADTNAKAQYSGKSTNVTEIIGSLAQGVSQMDRLAEDSEIELKWAGEERGTIIGSYRPGTNKHLNTDFTTPRQDYRTRQQTEFAKRRQMYIAHVVHAMNKISAAVDPQTGDLLKADGETGQYLPYNELNTPASTDWQVVLQFVLRKMSLYDIPAHYLITDAANLPRESLKYFYVDSNWIDALLDGMLSIGNHLEQEDDLVKQAMKNNLNRYFATPYGLPEADYRPQVPCFGFLLRSSIVKAFPGLEISAPFPDASSKRQQAIVVERIEEEVLLCLFDRMPGSKYWHPTDGISISPPPHQPCFRLGNTLAYDEVADVGKLVVQLRPLYTTEDELPYEEQGRQLSAADPEYRWRSLKPVTYTTVKGVDASDDAELSPKRVFDFENRMLVLPAYGTMCLEFLEREVNKDVPKVYFHDDVPTSVLVGLQLNASIPALVIKTPSVADTSHPLDTIDTVRQIRVPAASNALPAVRLSVGAGSAPSQSITQLAPEVDHGAAVRVPQYTRSTVVDDDVINSSKNQTGIAFLDGFIAKAEYHLRQRREAQALARPYITPSKLLRPDFFSRLVGSIGDLVTEAEGGQVPINDYIPSQYDTVVQMVDENDLQGYSDGNLPPVDLVFHIVFRDFTDKTQKLSDKLWDKPDLQLFSLQVDLPLGAGPSNISEAYNGGGAKMLNNQLFTVHQEDVASEELRAKHSSDSHFVRFTLIPRTTTRSIPLSKCGDMSFIVNQIVPGVKQGKSSFFITENYRSRWVKPPGPAPAAAVPAPPTKSAAVHPSQLFWRQHQAAHSTNLVWGNLPGWGNFFRGMTSDLVGDAFETVMLGLFLVGAAVGVPVIVVSVKLFPIVQPWTVRAVVWTAHWIWRVILFTLAAITVITSIVLMKMGESRWETISAHVGTRGVRTALLGATTVYVIVKLLSLLLPRVWSLAIWLLTHWLYVVVFGISAATLSIITSAEDPIAKASAMLLLGFRAVPDLILALSVYVAARVLMFFGHVMLSTVLPPVWNDMLWTMHWTSIHRVLIEMVTVTIYLTIWYRTSNRYRFYSMAYVAALVVIGTSSGLVTAWTWDLLFGK